MRGAGRGAIRYGRNTHGEEVCVSWNEGHRTSPERKVYAKDAKLVRLEIALRGRERIKPMLGRHLSRGLTGGDVVQELVALARAAAPLLDDAVDSINSASGALARGGADIIAAFAPLSRLAAPAPRAPGAGGRPHGGTVAPKAARAIEQLIYDGRVDMRGCPDSCAVLAALRQMCRDGWLCESRTRPRLFTVAPALEAAKQALAGVRAGSPEEDQ
jgi:hypothetical protein